jgi:acyl-CoA reductase-like NAD-dependent aldehyde dehydrogenase
LRIAELIERDLDKLARAESVDTGKQLSLARGLDIPRAASNFRFFATAILHTESEAHITDGVAFNYTLRQPRGIAGTDFPVESALVFVELENCASDCVWEYGCGQTERTNADDSLSLV